MMVVDDVMDEEEEQPNRNALEASETPRVGGSAEAPRCVVTWDGKRS
jgi:hypothetical protein